MDILGIPWFVFVCYIQIPHAHLHIHILVSMSISSCCISSSSNIDPSLQLVSPAQVNPILSPDPNLFILQSYLPNVPEIHSLGTSDLEPLSGDDKFG